MGRTFMLCLFVSPERIRCSRYPCIRPMPLTFELPISIQQAGKILYCPDVTILEDPGQLIGVGVKLHSHTYTKILAIVLA